MISGLQRRAQGLLDGWAGLSGWKMGLALFVTGLVSVLAHAPFFFQPALIAGLVLLVLALDASAKTARPRRSGFWRGWCFGAGYFLGGTWWVANAFLVSAEEHAWLIWAPLTLLPGGLALFWGLAASLYTRLAPDGPSRIGLFAILFTAVEMARSVVLSGFPWNLAGHVFEAGTPVSQAASYIGAAGSFRLRSLRLCEPPLRCWAVLADGRAPCRCWSRSHCWRACGHMAAGGWPMRPPR